MEALIRRTSFFIWKYYKIIIFVYSLVILICIAGLFRITINTSLLDVLPDRKGVKVFKEIMADIRSENSLIIQVESESGDILKHTDLIRDIAKGLKESSLVKTVMYNRFIQSDNFFVKHFPLYLDADGIEKIKHKLSKEGIKTEISKDYSIIASPFSSPLRIFMVERDPLNIAEIFLEKLKKNDSLKALDLSSGYYLSKDHRFALIFVTPVVNSHIMDNFKKLERDIKSRIGAIISMSGRKGIRIGYLGPVALSWELYNKLSEDLIKSLGITLIVIFIVLLIIFQWNLMIPLIFLLLLSTVSLTLNATQLLFSNINIITALVSTIIVGLGIDYHIHIFDRFSLEISKHNEVKEALNLTLITTGRSVLTGGLTTIGAFLSIMITDFKGLHQLGIVAALGIAFSIITAIIVLPAIMLFSKERLRFKTRKKSISYGTVISEFFFKYSIHIGVFTILLMLISIPGIMKLRFDTGLQSIGLKNSLVMKKQTHILGKSFYKLQPLIILTSVKSIDNDLNQLERLLDRLKKEGLVSRYRSLSEIIPPMYKQLMVIDKLNEININGVEQIFIDMLKKYNFRVTKQMKDYIKIIVDALKRTSPIRFQEIPDELRNQARYFYNVKDKRLLAYIYPSGNIWSSETIKKIIEILNSTDRRFKLTGWPLVSKRLKSLIIKQSIMATFISIAFCILLAWLQFRAWKIILLCLLSPIIGFYLTCTLIGITGLSFNYINIASTALLFGISIDYAVYLLQAFKENASEFLIVHTIKDILICAISTVVGFITLTFTSFKGIATLGEIVSIGIVSSLLSLSLIISLFYRRRRHENA